MRLGIDLGGTKIEAAVLAGDGSMTARRRVPTPGSYTELLTAVAALVAQMEDEVGAQCSVGLGTPGAISPHTGLMKNANNTALNGRSFDRDLSSLLERPVRLANDAHCFALSEASDGAGAGASVVFGVIVGTGTGGGIVVNGELLTGINAIGGEWGHNPLPWPRGAEVDGPSCYCGKQGCIETYLSGPGLSRDHELVNGERCSGEVLAERAAAGDGNCLQTLERYADRMARALASVINIVDPDVIVLGGGVSKIQALYELVPQRWGDYVFSDHVATRLACNVHGDASGVRGAAWLWPAGV